MKISLSKGGGDQRKEEGEIVSTQGRTYILIPDEASGKRGRISRGRGASRDMRLFSAGAGGAWLCWSCGCVLHQFWFSGVL